ncbi:MAG: hypothetical protein NTX15_07710 [Candidatus Kapabacteria bacterium]|nr:hypothetical protein [Candidatus Kapabacteria bacterium]
MNTLPSIEPPEDFERNVHIRSLLSTLPGVTPPGTFEQDVLRSARRSGVKIPILIATIAAIGISFGIWWFTSQPNNVVVHKGPEIAVPTSVVVPPVSTVVPPVAAPASSTKKKRIVRKPHGVAGH